MIESAVCKIKKIVPTKRMLDKQSEKKVVEQVNIPNDVPLLVLAMVKGTLEERYAVFSRMYQEQQLTNCTKRYLAKKYRTAPTTISYWFSKIRTDLNNRMMR